MLRTSRKQELKERIFQTAVGLFRDKGFEQVTVEEITAACGIAKGTFFNYFPRKEHVLLHLAEAQHDRLDEALELHRSVPEFAERIRRTFGELFARYEGQSELLRFTMAETIRSALLLQAEGDSIRRFQAKLLVPVAEAQQSGLLRADYPAAALASALVGLYFQTLLGWSMQAEAPAEERVAPEVLFERGLTLLLQGMEGGR